MESKAFIYTPTWVKTVSILILCTMLVLSGLVILSQLDNPGVQNRIILALSLAQIATSGLVIAIVVFFSERDVLSRTLRLKTERFLCHLFPHACRFLSFTQPGFNSWPKWKPSIFALKTFPINSDVVVDIAHVPGTINALYRIKTPETKLHMRIQCNVFEVVISHYFPAESEENCKEYSEKLSWWITRYKDMLGFSVSWYFSQESFDDKFYVSLHLFKMFEKDFLEDERVKVFFVQDVVASTRSLIKKCKIKGIPLNADS